MIFVPLVYGTLQIATFSGWRASIDRQLRRMALFLGLGGEIALAVALVYRIRS